MKKTRLTIAALCVVMACSLAANADLQIIVDGMSNAVNTRISGLAGGEPFMQMFSTKNHTTTNYVRNTSMWAFDLTDQLTACAVYKDRSYESYGGILITPRHVLYCRHAHPHAQGTWSPNLNAPCDLRFVDRDNNPIIATQLHQASDSSVDLAVGLLDRNMEELGLHVMPISPVAITHGALTGAGINVTSLPMMGMSQGHGRTTGSIPPSPFSDYPQYNDIMFYIKDLYSLGSATNKPYSHFNYGVWDGDSGTPTFILYEETLYLHTILTHTPWGGPSVPMNIAHINNLIAQADQNAIGMGRLDAPTGYTVHNHVTLTFDSAGGSDVPAIMQNYGTAVTPPADPTRTGYTFVDWDPAVPGTMPFEDLTLTAQWTINAYTLTFDSAGGSDVTAITQDYGTAVTPPDDPTRTDYNFMGWVPAVPDTMPAENLTLAAQWRGVNAYTLTFDSAGGSDVPAITQDYDTAVTPPDDPTRTGYTFAGWDPVVPEIMPTEDLTLTAQWTINAYTLTFDSAGGSDVTAITQDYGTAVTPPADPTTTRAGYRFAGWNPAVPATMPAENLTLTAQWTRYTYATGYVSDSFEPPEGFPGLPIGEYKRIISGVNNETTNVVWYAASGDVSTLVPTNAAYADIHGDGPITNETSSLILNLATGGTTLSRIAGVSFASAPAYIDTLIQFTCEDASTIGQEDVKIALFSTAQSNLVVRHMYMDAIPASVSHVTNTVIDLGYPIDSSKWYRLSFEIKDLNDGLFATKMFIDGSPITDDHAFTDDETPALGGSYFINIAQDSTIEFISLMGTGHLDELVVSDEMPLFPPPPPAIMLTLVAEGGTVVFSVAGTPVTTVESGTEIEIAATDDWYVIGAVTGPIDQDLSGALPAKAVTNVLTASADGSVKATVELVSGTSAIGDLDVDMAKLAAWAMAQNPVKGEGDIVAEDLDDYLLNVEVDTNAKIEITSIVVDKIAGTTTIRVGASTELVDFTDINGTVTVYSTKDLTAAFSEVTSVPVTITPTTPLVTIEIEDIADQFLRVVVQ